MALAGMNAVAGNLHEQIDQCKVTSNETCTREILHQLAKGQKPTGITRWCICEGQGYNTMLYLMRIFPDGTKGKTPVYDEPVGAAHCAKQLLIDFCNPN